MTSLKQTTCVVVQFDAGVRRNDARAGNHGIAIAVRAATPAVAPRTVDDGSVISREIGIVQAESRLAIVAVAAEANLRICIAKKSHGHIGKPGVAFIAPKETKIKRSRHRTDSGGLPYQCRGNAQNDAFIIFRNLRKDKAWNYLIRK